MIQPNQTWPSGAQEKISVGLADEIITYYDVMPNHCAGLIVWVSLDSNENFMFLVLDCLSKVSKLIRVTDVNLGMDGNVELLPKEIPFKYVSIERGHFNLWSSNPSFQ